MAHVNSVFYGWDAAASALPSGQYRCKVFSRRWYAEERAFCVAGHERALGLFRLGACAFEVDVDQGVDACVALLDAVDEMIHDLDRGDLLRHDLALDGGGAHVRDALHLPLLKRIEQL